MFSYRDDKKCYGQARVDWVTRNRHVLVGLRIRYCANASRYPIVKT